MRSSGPTGGPFFWQGEGSESPVRSQPPVNQTLCQPREPRVREFGENHGPISTPTATLTPPHSHRKRADHASKTAGFVVNSGRSWLYPGASTARDRPQPRIGKLRIHNPGEPLLELQQPGNADPYRLTRDRQGGRVTDAVAGTRRHLVHGRPRPLPVEIPSRRGFGMTDGRHAASS